MLLKRIIGKKYKFEKIDTLKDSICKICLENEGIIEEDNLISPCKCKGTMKFVHRECLRRWRYHKKNLYTINSCDQCKNNYEVIDEYIPEVHITNILTFLSFSSIIFLSNFILNTLLEAYIYTYKMCKKTNYHDLLIGNIEKENTTIEFLEQMLRNSSIYKIIIYFAFINILFSISKDNFLIISLYLIFLWRCLTTSKQIDHYFLFTLSILNLKSFYLKIYEYIYSTILYLLNY